MAPIEDALSAFALEHSISSKGPLSVVLVITRICRDRGLPVDPGSFLTGKKGQVAGLGKGPVQAILADYGIIRVLAEEGGRTSRGSVGLMQAYVPFLNDLANKGAVDFAVVERWWVERVKEYFASEPLKIRVDMAKSMRFVVRDILDQAKKKETQGTMFVGAVLQHLVGAKLELAVPGLEIEHKGFSVADAPSGRAGDFLIKDVAIHVTTAPTEALVRKCSENLNNGIRPIIVTGIRGAGLAEGLLANAEIDGRVDVFEAEQFVALNLYELSEFAGANRRTTLSELVEKYNQIIESCETDPGLRIVIGD